MKVKHLHFAVLEYYVTCVTDVSGLLFGPIFEDEAVQGENLVRFGFTHS